MSIIRLLKLTFMAHGWTLAIKEVPLVSEYVQAWRHGPVITSIYYSYRPMGVHKIKPFPLLGNTEIDSDTGEILENVYDAYKNISTNQLSALTHMKGGPWHRAYKPNKLNIIIPNEWIAEHFKDKLKRAQNEQSNS